MAYGVHGLTALVMLLFTVPLTLGMAWYVFDG